MFQSYRGYILLVNSKARNSEEIFWGAGTVLRTGIVGKGYETAPLSRHGERGCLFLLGVEGAVDIVVGLDFGKGMEDDGGNDDEGDEKHEGSVSSGQDGNSYNDTCNIHCKGCDFQGLGGGVLHHGLAFRLGEVSSPLSMLQYYRGSEQGASGNQIFWEKLFRVFLPAQVAQWLIIGQGPETVPA